MKKILSAIFQEKVFQWLYRLAILTILAVTFLLLFNKLNSVNNIEYKISRIDSDLCALKYAIKDNNIALIEQTRQLNKSAIKLNNSIADITFNTQNINNNLTDINKIIRNNNIKSNIDKLRYDSISKTINNSYLYLVGISAQLDSIKSGLNIISSEYMKPKLPEVKIDTTHKDLTDIILLLLDIKSKCSSIDTRLIYSR
jgi:hypothetical protein